MAYNKTKTGKAIFNHFSYLVAHKLQISNSFIDDLHNAAGLEDCPY